LNDVSYLTADGDYSSADSSLVQKKKRKSWFTSKPLQFEIAIEKLPEYENQENGVEHLELTYFSQQPKIDFGRLRLGMSATRILIVHNPDDYEQQVMSVVLSCLCHISPYSH